MSTFLVTDCPRCDAKKTTFDLRSAITGRHINGQGTVEAFCQCRHCRLSTVFVLRGKSAFSAAMAHVAGGLEKYGQSIDFLFSIEGPVSFDNKIGPPPPIHLPEPIRDVFREATTCMGVGCFNAAGTMFRLALDVATKEMLPSGEAPGLTTKVRRNLGYRLPWLFDTQRLPEGLRELATSVKEDGNDGAHEGTLTRIDAEDLFDFTTAVLDRIYSEPIRLKAAQERRKARRDGE